MVCMNVLVLTRYRVWEFFGKGWLEPSGHGEIPEPP